MDSRRKSYKHARVRVSGRSGVECWIGRWGRTMVTTPQLSVVAVVLVSSPCAKRSVELKSPRDQRSGGEYERVSTKSVEMFLLLL